MKAPFPITELTLPNHEYVDEVTPKSMLFLHHSAGWDNVRGMFKDWADTPGRVATAYGMDDDGQIYRAFDDAYWAYHLYIRSKGNKLPEAMRPYKVLSNAIYLEKVSVGIEIANFGPLKYRNGKYYTWVHDFGTRGKGVTLAEDKVFDFKDGFRGYRFYERYTDNEVGALKVWIKFMCEKHNIPFHLPKNMFELCEDAFKRKPGIYTHCSVRTDKTDIVPQKNMVAMLNSLRPL
jgi:hypothetical protein